MIGIVECIGSGPMGVGRMGIARGSSWRGPAVATGPAAKARASDRNDKTGGHLLMMIGNKILPIQAIRSV